MSTQPPISKICPICNGSGWEPTGENGKVRRCRCLESVRVERLIEEARIPQRYEHCDLDSYLPNHESQKKAKIYVQKFLDKYPQIDVGLLFLGTCGVSLENGLTNRNMHEISVKQKMIEVSREVILLADHTKFGRSALSPFAQLSQIDKIITDDKAPKELVSAIESEGVDVLIAPSING